MYIAFLRVYNIIELFSEKFYKAVGQNLYLSSSTRKPTDRPWKAAVDGWYSEFADYYHFFKGDVSVLP